MPEKEEVVKKEDATPIDEAKLKTDITAMLASEKRNLEDAKAQKRDAEFLKVQAAKEITDAQKERVRIIEEAKKKAQEIEGGSTARAQMQFAKDLLDSGEWDKDTYNSYVEKRGLKNLEMQDNIRSIVHEAINPLIEQLKPKPVEKTEEDPMVPRVVDAAKKILASIPQFDGDDAKYQLKKIWEKDPDNFNPETAAENIIKKFGGKQEIKKEDKDLPPDEAAMIAEFESVKSSLNR